MNQTNLSSQRPLQSSLFEPAFCFRRALRLVCCFVEWVVAIEQERCQIQWDPRRTSIVASDTMQLLVVVPWWVDENPGAKKNWGGELTSVIGSR
jgi:hypothetical protein